MIIDGFIEIFNMVYIAKKLHEVGKGEIVSEKFGGTLSYDAYYENTYVLMDELFEYHSCHYHEYKNLELHVVSDPVIERFYVLAGEYGRQNNICDDENLYIKNARDEVRRWLDFSYCLGWTIAGHTKPKRKLHSRLGLFIYHDDHVDLGCLAYGLIEIFCWFEEQCEVLQDVLSGTLRKESFVA